MGENVNWNDVKSVIIDGNKVTNFSIDSSSIDGISTFEISGIYSPETLIIDTDTTSRHDEIKNKKFEVKDLIEDKLCESFINNNNCIDFNLDSYQIKVYLISLINEI